jgi:membrane associated rhomboid family serine protease
MSFSATEEFDDRPRTTPAVQWLIGINVLIYFLQVTLVGTADMERWLGFEAHDLFRLQSGWTILTHMFVHASLLHLVGNMVMLWVFGPRVERAWGSGAFVRYYVLCGLGGWLAHLLTAREYTLVGASAAIYGVMLAYAVRWPDDEFLLWFVVPVRAKWLVAGCVLVDLLLGVSSLNGGPGGGVAHFAHLGGLAAGWLYLHTPPAGFDLLHSPRVSSTPDVPDEPPRAIPRALPRQPRESRDRQETDEIVAKSKAAVAKRPAPAPAPSIAVRGRPSDDINSLLDKISRQGLDSLTSDERRLLEEASKRLRGSE